MNKKKCRGKVRVTNEMLHQLLKLPDEIEIINANYDNSREIFTFYLRSNEPLTNCTYEIEEGGEIASSFNLPLME